jgi:hypothetical protein
VVLEGRPIVEHRAVVEEDRLARLERELELDVGPARHFLEVVQRFLLRVAQGVAQFLRGHFDVGPQKYHGQLALAL